MKDIRALLPRPCRAGVAVQTVYSSVGSKSHVLVALVDHIRAEAGVPSMDQQVREALNPVDIFCIGARMPSNVLRIGADVFRLLRESPLPNQRSPRSGPGSRERFERVSKKGVRRLDELGALRDGVTVTSATDMISSSTGLEAALSLLELGWTHDEIGDMFERISMMMVIKDEFIPDD